MVGLYGSERTLLLLYCRIHYASNASKAWKTVRQTVDGSGVLTIAWQRRRYLCSVVNVAIFHLLQPCASIDWISLPPTGSSWSERTYWVASPNSPDIQFAIPEALYPSHHAHLAASLQCRKSVVTPAGRSASRRRQHFKEARLQLLVTAGGRGGRARSVAECSERHAGPCIVRY